jgi:hypothetical protein
MVGGGLLGILRWGPGGACGNSGVKEPGKRHKTEVKKDDF